MRIPKKTFKSWLRGVLDFSRLPLLPRRSGERTLLILSPVRVPGIGAILTLSHSREKVKWYLFCKHVLEGLNENEKIVFMLLTTKGNDEEYRFFKEVQEFDFLPRPIAVRMALIEKVNELVSFTRSDPTQCLRCWTPSLQFNRFWFDRKRFPPIQYIGVGYKDKGSLNSSTRGVEEFPEDPLPAKYRSLMFIFRILFGLPLIPDNPEVFEGTLGKQIRLMSLGKAK